MNNSALILKKGMNIVPSMDNYPNGIIIPLDKPYEWTSADAVRKIKFKLQRYFGSKNIKVGHAGTLDPLATGILLICVGKATKIAEKLQAEKKEYIAEIQLGATTPCFDREKEIDKRYPFEHITKELIQSVLPPFLGEQEQVPPIFSAKLINGVRAYEMARQGEEVKMRSSIISIYNLEIIDYSSPILTLRVECSKGTYIRSLARDLGIALESGVFLQTSKGQFLEISHWTLASRLKN